MTDTMDDGAAFAPLDAADLAAATAIVAGQPASRAPAFRAVLPAPLPVPDELPFWKPHRRLAGVWIYANAAAKPLFLVARFDLLNPDGTPVLGSDGKPKKETPSLVCAATGDGIVGWRWMHPPDPRPVYGLDRLAAQSEAPVLLVEGEKTADAAQVRFPDHIAMTWQGGSGSVGKADWSVLHGRIVIIWRDNDAAGEKAARDLVDAAHAAGATRIFVVDIPRGYPEKWDLADPLPTGITDATLRQLLDEALEVASSAATETALADAETMQGVPPGFALCNEGLFAIDDGERFRVCGQLEVAAVTQDGAGHGYGRLLRWDGTDGEPHEWAMPMTMLAGDGVAMRERLLDEGLDLEPGHRQRQLLFHYIHSAKPVARVTIVHRLGWHDTSVGPVFVLLDGALGPPGAPPLVIQTDRPNALPPVEARGTLAEWQDNVAALCRGNSRLVLAISTAFAASLLAPLGAEGGGLHLRGPSSAGKSTLLVTASSVWGGGGLRGRVQSWRATDNGLEGIAQAHCDQLLCLDEMSEASAEAVNKAAYMLANGTGKARARTDGAVRRAAEWRVLFLSSGEESLADRLAEAYGGARRVRAGQQVRVVDLPADAGAGLGIFEELHGEQNAGAFADRLKAAARTYYGTAGRAFLQAFVANAAELTREARAACSSFKTAHVPQGAAGQVARVADRFALIAAAGEMATTLGILPWNEGEAKAAAARCFRAWLAAREGGTAGAADPVEATAALAQVRHFLMTQGGARFVTLRADDEPLDARPVANRAGWRKRIGRRGDGRGGHAWYFCIPPGVWQHEVCAGLNPKVAARALRDAGFLLQQGGRLARMERVGLENTIRVYAIKEAILSGLRRADEADEEDCPA